MKETQECIIFAKILRSKGFLFSKIPSEIWTPSYNQIKKQKAEWLNKWVPDYLIIVPKKNWKEELVFIEMKKQKGWIVSEHQKKWLESLNKCWVKAVVCKWVIEAVNFISKIMNDE